MTLARVLSRARVGMEAPEVLVEVHISNGLPAFQIVGLPDASVRESRDRVRSALINSQFLFPQTRITINLSPADIPKEGARFDLAIAIGILVASEQLTPEQIYQYEFYGELGLDGSLRAIIGDIPSLLASNNHGRKTIIPIQNQPQVELIGITNTFAANSLIQVFHHLNGQQPLSLIESSHCHQIASEPLQDLNEVIGQQQAKRALEIAAAGQHNLLFIGPPGTGKSMLASRLTTILPDLTNEEALEVASILSINGKTIDKHNWQTRPFRQPHHTASGVALVGGGSIPKPGEISLAHNGVLFLDELPEFQRQVLDVLREPIENGKITISRANHSVEFPARFQLIAALNPSPTGSINDGRSTADQVLKYLSKVSGPLLDRIDLQIDVPQIKGIFSSEQQQGESSITIKQRVQQARSKMLTRCGKSNALMSNKEIMSYCNLTSESQTYLEMLANRFNMSARVCHKIIKVARTIADLEDANAIDQSHIIEAASYRAMERLLDQLKR